MTPQHYFCEDYFSARKLFVEVCSNAGLRVEEHLCPATGPIGERLTTDAVLIGAADATNLIVLISGTHGVETLVGSACQSGYVAEGSWRDLPDDTAVLLIHALNCWGAAHLRRNNEDNVDLARNFLNFDEGLPDNPAYEEIHEAVCCKEHRGAARDKANRILADFFEKEGISAYISAIMGGQYRHADGMAFGGTQAVWSNALLQSLLSHYGRTANDVFVVEYHSGLGPYAYGTAVTMQTGDELACVRSIYGRWVEAPNERVMPSEHYHRVRGHPTDGVRAVLPDANLSAIVLEFGTYPPDVSLPVLLDDHWLTHHGDVASELGQDIKRRLLEMHYPADPDWRQAIWDRSCQVLEQTTRLLR